MNAFLRIAGIALAIALIALPVVAVVNGWIGTERFPLTKLRVSGDTRHVDDAQLQKVLAPYARQGFFAVRLRDAQAELVKLPWVESAEVSKKWPDVLVVRIREHRPFALWGRDRVLSATGRLYPRSAMDPALLPGLPLLGGDSERVPEVVAFYNEAREALGAAGIGLRALELDARGSWSMRLDIGTEVVIGRQDAQARTRRFAQMLPGLLSQREAALLRADLRYANGFALKWGEVTSPNVLPRKTA